MAQNGWDSVCMRVCESEKNVFAGLRWCENLSA